MLKASAIELWNVSDLKPYEANAKVHSQEQVESLAKLIKWSGWTQPIIVWTDGSIIAGHGRRLAAIHLEMEKVPVIVRSDLTKAEADALRLADNRVTSTDYDQEAISEELKRLNAELELEGNISLGDLGFDEKEIDFTLADMGEMDESMFTDDISTAVEEQKAENAGVAKELDETAAPIVDALGFKRVTVNQSREVRDLMRQVETKTGKEGVEALIAAMRSQVAE